ncbi:hypothetical protein Val02_85520 [Virgisporangium aliadipatigenens]|uniref:histidine kinase n=1 Tax=Virgisporangium aliadipatigenens TaxID=741659 RepID=A0A8J3YXS9_9ACTN|nr:ATP-binding protein [Virgisporangium aliadipatigenens]GIJ51666.1 hypothetical protein Val02_85520 [Virgisporangium aliadipatigenens]
MTAAVPEQLSFTVDTHLLRELGALLVGRESTALLELIKNSYDADARRVTVHGEALHDPSGYILISDDGNGMTFARFRDAFLRIAGRDKENNRLSRRFGRRFTGAKGIGRLSAHKLASSLIIDSLPRDLPDRDNIDEVVGVHARLDWDRMEHEHEDLGSLGDTLIARRVEVTEDAPRGTSLTLTGLRDSWPQSRLGPFLSEIRRCRPPEVLIGRLPAEVIRDPLLFAEPIIREHGPDDPGFFLELTGDFESGDELWLTMAHRADWIIEIDSTSKGVNYGVSPTRRTFEKLSKRAEPSWIRTYRFSGTHPDPKRGPFFQARIMVTEGTLGPARSRAPLANFSRHESGIRVFLEGFRVLPYGSAGDDWLLLDRDYVKRRREYQVDVEDSELSPVDNEGFFQLGNRAYYGAVFLTEGRAPHLQALVNREGFLPDSYFENLRSMVRSGVDLCVRTRAALDRRITDSEKHTERRKSASSEQEPARRIDENGNTSNQETGSDRQDLSTTPASTGSTSSPAVKAPQAVSPSSGIASLEEVLSNAVQAFSDARASQTDESSKNLGRVVQALDLVRHQIEDVRDEHVMLRTLAGLGTQYAAFVHEVNGLLSQAQAMRRSVERLMDAGPYTPEQLRGLRRILGTSDELVQALTRQASYLSDVIGPDARRRRQRLVVRDRIESALRLLQSRIGRRQQIVTITVDHLTKSPPIFPAELAIVLTNLLTNAVKFAGIGGKILVRAWLDERASLHLVVENSGLAVATADRERFFRPFESTTVEIDAVLGQGMGLGLPIVRSLLADYNGTAQFVDPSDGFQTSVEVVLPDPRPRPPRDQPT